MSIWRPREGSDRSTMSFQEVQACRCLEVVNDGGTFLCTDCESLRFTVEVDRGEPKEIPNQFAVRSTGSAETSNSRSDKLVQDNGSCLVYGFSKIADRRIERLDDSFGNSRQRVVEDERFLWSSLDELWRSTVLGRESLTLRIMKPRSLRVAFLETAVGALRISNSRVDMKRGELTPATCTVACLAIARRSLGVAGLRPIAIEKSCRTRAIAST